MQYTVDYFIKKFEAIPENLWVTGVFYFHRDNHVLRCAMGHCGVTGANETLYNEEAIAFNKLIDISRVYRINDGENELYLQPTPKQRILAALYDIKKMQEPVEEPKVKEIIRYVAVPETISEMETVLN